MSGFTMLDNGHLDIGIVLTDDRPEPYIPPLFFEEPEWGLVYRMIVEYDSVRKDVPMTAAHMTMQEGNFEKSYHPDAEPEPEPIGPIPVHYKGTLIGHVLDGTFVVREGVGLWVTDYDAWLADYSKPENVEARRKREREEWYAEERRLNTPG